MKTQTIGVEIEMTGLTRKAAADTVAKHFGTTAVYVGGTYETYEVKDNNGRAWKLMCDSSIKAQVKNENGNIATIVNQYGLEGREYKVELVTPILNYGDIETLQEIVRKIRKAGALVNPSCGMHIHVGAKDFTPQTVRNLVNTVASKEDLLIHALKVHRNRIGEYCRRTNRRFLKELNEKKPATMAQLAAIWYNEPEDSAIRAHRHYDDSRYTICNLHALFTKGTIEFRIFNSTLHAGEIKSAIQFCLALTHQALTTKKAIYRRTVSDNEKYTFRCWLLRLNLIGDEFKTCRHHLLKNLEGNSAWRMSNAA